MSGCAGSSISPFAYPNFWDYTKSAPKSNELIGAYKVHKISNGGSISSFHAGPDARVILNSDHTAVVFGVPVFDAFGEKMLYSFSGAATWQIAGKTGEWQVDIRSSGLARSKIRTEPGLQSRRDCEANWNESLLVVGKRPPYRLYQFIGDPDNDVGIEFAK